MSRSIQTFLFSLLALTFCADCADKTPPPGLPSLTTAFTDNGRLYYLDTQAGILNNLMSSHYFQARLSPDKTKIACVREGDFFVTVFDLGPDHEVIGKPKNIYNSQALSSNGTQGKCDYPTWSADGNRLFFINTNHLVAYDYQEKHTTVLFDFPDTQSGGLETDSGNMALSRDGSSLYCFLGQGDQYAFWRIDAAGSQESQLALADKSSVRDLHFPPELSEECIETLFGSKENPVWDPAISNDGRYYLYGEDESGFLAKRLLKGYDRTQKTKFDVLTLGTMLFK